MIKLLPLLLALLGLYVMTRFSAWQMARQLRAKSRVLKHDTLERLIDRIAVEAGIDRIAVRVLEEPTVNGLVTPSGDIYVTSGLIQHYQRGRLSGEEVTSVIAHELGHLALGHTRRRMIDVSAAQTAGMVLGGILSRFIPFIGFYIAQALIGLFVTKLSRRDEFEADAFATALMVKAGFGAEPQARMLEKLETLSPMAGTGRPPPWLASHPPVPDRAAAIRENAHRWRERAA
ncbi:MAG: M48 family metallopeptidase [Pseudomonadota bacterium]